MLNVTPSALEKLSNLLTNHPEEKCVRVIIKDLGDARRVFKITLEEETHPGDRIQEIGGLTFGIPKMDSDILNGVTLDYHEGEGFKFHHPTPDDGDYPNPIQLN